MSSERYITLEEYGPLSPRTKIEDLLAQLEGNEIHPDDRAIYGTLREQFLYYRGRGAVPDSNMTDWFRRIRFLEC